MKITKLEKIQTKKDVFKLSFDNGESMLLSADIIVKFRLNAGVEISDDTYKEILAADKAYRVMFDALTLIGKRPYCAKGLYDKLIQKGYEPQGAQAAVERLTELEYINDEKYAQNLAKYLTDNGKGEFAVKQELSKKGISKDVIEKSIKSLNTEQEPFEQILKMLESKFKNFNPKDKTEVRRAANFFLRRGYTSEDISKAFRNFKNVSLDEE